MEKFNVSDVINKQKLKNALEEKPTESVTTLYTQILTWNRESSSREKIKNFL